MYQTSFNFENYGYAPTRNVQIVSPGTNVTSPTYRLVYVAPPNFAYTSFTYNVTDSNGLSHVGLVTITASDSVIVSSTFWIDNEGMIYKLFCMHEGWIVQAAVAYNSSWSATSTGNLNYFIYGGDFDPTVGFANDVLWYFQAPSKFSGYGDDFALF